LRVVKSVAVNSSRMARELGPWRANAAVDPETSSIRTFSPIALRCSQRRLGSAAVRRNVCSPRREMVPSSITFPAASHHGVYNTWPTLVLPTLRVTTRSRSRSASGPVIKYL